MTKRHASSDDGGPASFPGRMPGEPSAGDRTPEPEPVLIGNVEGGVLTLTLNRPKTLNALNGELVERLTEAVVAAGQGSRVRAVVITGAGRGFCSGQDLGEYRAEGGSEGVRERLERLYIPLILAIRACPRPVIAAVNGVAAGAGASLALACDLIYAARGAALIEAFVQIGLVPDSGSTYFLTRALGRARALELMWSGRPLAAEEAAAIGLINGVAEPGELLPRVGEIARNLAGGPTKALALIKETASCAERSPLEAVLARETRAQAEAAATRDHQNALAAFFRKEKPTFEGS